VWQVRRRLRWPPFRAFGPDERHDWIAAASGDVVGFFVMVLALLVFFVVPLALFVVELALVLGAVVLLRGTWVIEASTAGPPPDQKTWNVRGVLRSRRVVGEVASQLQATPAQQGEVTGAV
jgi:hypothetical protein